MEAIDKKQLIKGGEFIIKPTEAHQVFIPEEFTEEQKMMAQTCKDFINKEILPLVDELDHAKDPSLIKSLMEKAGALGLLSTSVPEAYGGLGMDFNSSMIVTDYIGAGHSFAVALSAHTGIGTLPILYYGNEAQKQKYLPKLGTGEWKAAYCLTEPDAGSDANAGKTKAVLSADGKYYTINGQKMWITNGGFADIFIVFAKLEDDKNLTAFIIEKDFGGITMNEPEKKMGIKGSDTRQIFFNDCKVPVENMLSTRQNGFKIAVNILNIGRIKLAVSAAGAAKAAITHAIKYANERKQFDTTIAHFGAIQHKIAESAAKIYATEAGSYRIGQNIEDAMAAFKASGMSDEESKLKSFEQFAIECAMLKVQGSEMLDYVVDETVQIFGGMGYSADAPAERCYRDARINRIFEGTNEINRMLAVGTVLKRAMKGELDILGPAMAVGKELTSVPDMNAAEEGGAFGAEKKVLANLKKVLLMIAGSAVQKFAVTFNDEQEIMMNLADIMIEIFAAESSLLRTEKLMQMRGEKSTALHKDLSLIYLHEAVNKINTAAREAIDSFAEGDEHRMLMMGLKRFTKIEPFNSKEARRRVAKFILEQNQYSF